MANEIIQIKDLKVHYPVRSGFWNRITDYVRAVDGISCMTPRAPALLNARFLKQDS